METNELIRILEENNYKDTGEPGSYRWYTLNGKTITSDIFHVDLDFRGIVGGSWKVYYVKTNTLSLRLL